MNLKTSLITYFVKKINSLFMLSGDFRNYDKIQVSLYGSYVHFNQFCVT